MKIALTSLRILLGALFVGHGTQKLFGWFDGHGLEATGDGFESMGLRPGKKTAAIAGISEAGGGVLLAAGLATPLAGAAITGTMAQAIRTVHAGKGPWASDGGWEYNAVVIAAVLAIVEQGPGPVSLDRALGTEHSGRAWMFAALAAGLAGPAVTTMLLEKSAGDRTEATGPESDEEAS